MSRPRILIQFDSDPQPSTFDAVVAVDSQVDHLFRHGAVTEENVTGLVHGAMFTRGGEDLKSTAVFIGGNDVQAGEHLLSAVQDAFFGPVRVSVMLDSNGCNTTASAAVLSAGKHLDLANSTLLVLGGTGPVGRRVARLLARQGAQVRIGSRSPDRAAEAAAEVATSIDGDVSIEGVSTAGDDALAAALEDCQGIVACGAAGVRLVDQAALEKASSVKLLIDLNAVPPAGIEGVEATDKGRERGDRVAYGALGVGGLKMKIHRAAIQSLFESNDRVLDADEIYQLGQELLADG
ncbi:NADP-dependent methylenetetrahydromethanopterin/methylenetetrahydrofolate dehydrogenase [Roseimaritima sediminicola]|uniref:NADP-dependent methylenetetrahydromethanopterin/methylenetetrahydrofolate dehydrogenase n=1 Tax=Roseimaritima sediminicola TaxID=2662066 RepID=UPI0012982FF1|nr:NADP-dependent methylenetetrahydromethanopterin/methylenetetrahydrofolate dehydrogenase [Roseimaritima sediminicola]